MRCNELITSGRLLDNSVRVLLTFRLLATFGDAGEPMHNGQE
jgi:hypothetical protein